MKRHRNLFYDIAAVLFISALFLFSTLRARYNLRWSSFALADAQNVTAAMHFAQEGFRTHYFLTYNHPGYLGQHSRNESGLGYEPHYPSLSAVLNGVLIRCFGENLFILRWVAILFGC